MSPEDLVQIIIRNQGINAGELATELKVKPPAISYHINKLEKEGAIIPIWREGKKLLFVRTYSEGSLWE